MSDNDDIDTEEIKANWNEFGLRPEIVKTLLSNGYVEPTEVQAHSLKYVNLFSDLIISARTGEGKTLCFVLPILNNLITKYENELVKNFLTKKSDPAKLKPIQDMVFRQTKALILSPTRELAIQIRDHLEKVIPEEYKKLITSCELIGGMSLLKQQRKLSYRPTILIGTPGRVWELIDDLANEYITDSLPKHLEVLVLDEADRMVEIGHYKEMNDILDFVYISREQNAFNKGQTSEQKETKQNVIESVSKNMLKDQSKFSINKNAKSDKNEKLQALLDQAEDIGDDLEDFDGEDLVLDEEDLNEIEETMTIRKSKKKKNNHKDMRVDKHGKSKPVKPDYAMRCEGIQTIVCSATLTLDSKGRIRPSKKDKPNSYRENFDALEEICKKLKFRQKHPKVINLTESLKMPEKLIETYHRCTNEEKDLYTYYFLQHHRQQSSIIFVNSITCIKRLSSMLKILQVPHQILHSKMQQRMRLKHFDRFKRDVITLKTEPEADKTAVMVCTDVASRGLDIPNVDNIIHYQMPVNAEIYLHRCGRTARIGKEGLAFSLFAPEDEKKFKLIYGVLKGRSANNDIKPVHIDMVELKRYQGFIETAKNLEKAIFDKRKNAIKANWLIKMSEETGIPISEELRKEVEGLEETEKEVLTRRQLKESDEQNIKKKRIKKKEDKNIGELKKDFHDMKQYKNLANVSTRSSFLNPNNVKYLNNALFGLGQLNNHQINKTILIDYLKPDLDMKKKKKKSNKRQINRHSKKRKRTLAQK
jgi:ATP-dependent RNA helicase DDX24/MAK5